ncbi:MAG TPA: hypothetical protein VK982_00065, partial [Bacteroidales bacterium]|nr:hypothetical protein [Bacteroidales bacterium]
ADVGVIDHALDVQHRPWGAVLIPGDGSCPWHRVPVHRTRKYDVLLARIKERITMGQTMFETDYIYEMDEKLNAAVLSFIQKEIQKSYNYFFLNQANEIRAYKNAVKEFCGFVL